jgi:hypothetical protein
MSPPLRSGRSAGFEFIGRRYGDLRAPYRQHALGLVAFPSVVLDAPNNDKSDTEVSEHK